LNAPPAVTYSAVIYALRCMVADDIPLNQGCLAPITFAIPDGCLLRPSAGAAVVGGNVLTSQRVTDVVLRAFGAAAASQGCMNNTTFGDEGLGYYETVAGGAGAGPGWHGRRCVRLHACMHACGACCACCVRRYARGDARAAAETARVHDALFVCRLVCCRSGVHTHMTNTRITDPEILERRYPVVLREFRRAPPARTHTQACCVLHPTTTMMLTM
jgi:5-oxoprolinase (ATP-hydrolysing)